MNQHNKVEEKYVLLLCDIVSILVSYFAALFIRYGKQIHHVPKKETYYIFLLAILLFCTIYALLISPSKDFVVRGYLVELQSTLKYNISVGIFVGFAIFLFRTSESFSRLVLGYFIIINSLLSYVARCVIKKVLKEHFKSERIRTNVMIITDKEHYVEIVAQLKANRKYAYDLVGVTVWDNTEDVGENDTIEKVPVVANKDNCMEVSKMMAIDEVFIYLPEEKSRVVEKLIMDMETMGVICHQNIGMMDMGLKVNKISNFGGYLVATYSMHEPDYQRLAIKRLIDIAGGFVGCVLFLIMYPFIGLAIKLESKGPVLFSQVRIGKNGRRFRIYKFRSMYIDAEERKKELESQNEMKGLMFKMENDPRVTRVGKFLRKTSLDEFPQFYNILKGDMSLVGTRPPTVGEFEQYTPYYRRRLCMTPGLTGMWQVSGRSEIQDFDEVVKRDLEYIDNWNLMLDVKILFMTVWVVLFGKGAK